MLNFRKTKAIKDADYGKNNVAKDDQSRYEMKVNDFLKYCRDFEISLKKGKSELKTIGDVRKCFKDSFKGYYKGSKKFGIFSRTTRVLNEMDKKLKKYEKMDLGDKNANKTLKEAFEYDSKRAGSEKGSRAAVDDRVVYNFFSEDILDTIKELMENTNQNSVNDKDVKEFVTRILKKLGEIKETTKKTRKSMQQTKQTIDKTQKDATVVTRNSMVDKEMKRKSELVQQASKRNSVELKKVDGNNNKIEEDTDKVAKELGNLKDKPLTPERMGELEKKVESLGQKAEDNKKQAEVIQEGAKENKEKVEEVQMKVEEKKEKNKYFEVEGTKLTIRDFLYNGDRGLMSFYSNKNSDEYKNIKNKCTTLVLDGVTIVDIEKVFFGFNFTTVKAPNVFTIGESAFSDCRSLKNIYLPRNRNILDSAFSNCSSLEEIKLTDVRNIKNKAFSGCSSLKNIYLPNVFTIGESAFSGCSSLETIDLSNATEIGKDAFAKCTNLQTVTLGGGKLKIGQNAFCPEKELTINVEDEAAREAILENCKNYKEKLKIVVKEVKNKFYEIKDTTLTIYKNKGLINFYRNKNSDEYKNIKNECTALVLDGVSDVNQDKVFFMFNFKTVTAPNTVIIGDSAFCKCESLTKIELPSVTVITGSAFYGCISLEKINLPNVNNIADGAFWSCESLKEVKSPDVKLIGGNAFKECRALKTIDLLSVTSIGGGAFASCKALTKINLPEVKNIGSFAFSACTNLTTVTLGQEEVRICENAFCPTDKELTINVQNEAIGKAILENCKSYKDKLKVLCNGQEIKLEDQKK